MQTKLTTQSLGTPPSIRPSRSRFATTLLSLLCLFTFFHPTTATAKNDDLTAEQILRLVRYSQALTNNFFKGYLSSDRIKIPFTLTMDNSMIRFRFFKPNQIIQLDLNEENQPLRNIGPGENNPVLLRDYNQTIRGTAINYEDISMRFLYWKNPKIERNYSDTWLVRVFNPDRVGPYQAVDIWVHKKSGGMKKMQAYDWQGRLIKRYEVKSFQKIDNVWMLKRLRIETLTQTDDSKDPSKTKVTNRTYLVIEDK